MDRTARHRYVTRVRRVSMLANSIARCLRAPGRTLLDASVLPNRGDQEWLRHEGAREPAQLDGLCTRTVARFLTSLSDAMREHRDGLVILPGACSEAMGLLRGIDRVGIGAALGSAVASHEHRWRAGTRGARAIDRALERRSVLALETLDRVGRASKLAPGRGRKTDVRLVAAAFESLYRRGEPATIVTRDEDVRRLAALGTRWLVSLGDPTPRRLALRVFKLDRKREVFRPYFDSRDVAAGARLPARAATIADTGRAWLDALAGRLL